MKATATRKASDGGGVGNDDCILTSTTATVRVRY
jgi:hypothetical protein